MGNKVFDNPKDEEVIQRLIQFCNLEDNDVVMDFFSGSGTTAHSTFLANLTQGKKRKFILVQLQEEISANLKSSNKKKKVVEDAIKLLDEIHAPYNICEIGKERIRRAGEKIKSENPLTTQDLDVGFRVLKVDESNMKNVYYHPDDLSQQNLLDSVENIKEDRSDLDLLFGCVLDWGLELSRPYTSEKVGSYTIHNYDDGKLVACFDENVSEELVRMIAKMRPERVVFRDSSFKSAPEKINLFEIFKFYMPESADEINRRVRVI